MGETDRESPAVVSAAVAEVGRIECNDPWEHEQSHWPWDLAVTPVHRGPYKNEITYLGGPGFTLYREVFRNRTQASGFSPASMFAFAVPVHTGRGTSWWGAPLQEDGLPATMPGGIHVDLSQGHEQIVGLIEVSRLRSILPPELVGAIEQAALNHVLPASPDSVKRLGVTLGAILTNALSEPGMLRSASVLRAVEDDFITAFRQALKFPFPHQKRVGRATRQGGLRRAVDFVRSTGANWVTVSELVARAHVTERTLEYAFRETFGMSPRGFLQLRRFHKARGDLLAADSQKATVKSIALRHGFYQLGRFAVRYKSLFGEPPSRTLRVPPVETPSRLPHLSAPA